MNILYGRNFEVFTDNNPLTYLLTMAKLKGTGQRWVVSLANYNFKLHYKSGKLNVEADALSIIPWEQEEELHTLDTIAVKAIISRGYNGDSSIPEVPPGKISVIAKSLVVDSTTKLSKQDWKREQQADLDIGPIITLINNKALLQYVAKEGDPSGMRILLKYWKDLIMKEVLLYRKVLLKGHDQPIAQFVLPEPFRHKAVLACHNDFGHMGMERTLHLLQERFFWPKMATDVRKHIRTCERFTHFKLTQERVEMKTVTASYPLELVHLDFLMIGTRNDGNKNVSVLIVMDHFTRYVAAYVTPKQNSTSSA